MKKQYDSPAVELLYVDHADVLTTSWEDDYVDEDVLDGNGES